MKKLILIIVYILAVTVLVPMLIVFPRKKEEEKQEVENQEAKENVKVYIKNEDRVQEMSTAQYLKEVVAAEMPADFYPEALKAQAVAARTYLTNRRNVYAESGTPPEHKGADICTDSTHCKAWISEAERKKLWGENQEEKWEKISKAVEDTKGDIITYEGQPISAVFHSTSSGATENAIDVWGGNVPYLVSVKSGQDSKSPKFNSKVSFSQEEYKKLCQEKIPGVDWQKGLFSDISRSGAGGIISIKIGGVNVKGTEFRNIFSLRSTNVDIQENSGEIIMEVKGYGHGVGMSQYGANFLAADGKNYVEILKTYYTGVEVENVYK